MYLCTRRISDVPDAAAGRVVVEHVVAVLPEDEGLRLRHLADGAPQLDRAARLVELLAHVGAALVDDLHHRGWGD